MFFIEARVYKTSKDFTSGVNSKIFSARYTDEFICVKGTQGIHFYYDNFLYLYVKKANSCTFVVIKDNGGRQTEVSFCRKMLESRVESNFSVDYSFIPE